MKMELIEVICSCIQVTIIKDIVLQMIHFDKFDICNVTTLRIRSLVHYQIVQVSLNHPTCGTKFKIVNVAVLLQ